MQRWIAALETENEILKKRSHIRQDKVKDKIVFVKKCKDAYPVETMYKVLELNRSTYYKDLHHKTTKAQRSNDELDAKILKAYYDSKRCYGAPKIFRAIRNEGKAASLKRVRRRMVALGIKSVVIKKYRPIKAEKSIEEEKNILSQDFSATSINRKWSTGITYIHTENEGWTYLASVEDSYSRKIMGRASGKTADESLAVKALRNTAMNAKHTEGMIIQPDSGCQYTSGLFEPAMSELKIHHSYSRKGLPPMTILVLSCSILS